MSRTIVVFENTPAGSYFYELFLASLRAKASLHVSDFPDRETITVTILDPFSSMEPRR